MMELKEWKDVEREAESQMQQCKIQSEVAGILYAAAIAKIKELGGLTNIEEQENSKRSVGVSDDLDDL